MGFFDKGVDPADYEKFRAWVVDRIGNLEQRVTATASESAIEAQAALAVVKAKSSEVEALVKELPLRLKASRMQCSRSKSTWRQFLHLGQISWMKRSF